MFIRPRVLLLLLVALVALVALRPGAPARGASSRPTPAYVVADLGVLPGGDTSAAAGINDRGQVVGYAYMAHGRRRAFRTSATGTLATPGADLGGLPRSPYSEARGINARGQIVGFVYAGTLEGPLRVRAFVYDDAATPRMRDLNSLIPAGSGIVLEEAGGINDAGQIAATGTVHGREHAFRLTPVGLARPMATPTR